MAIAVSFFPSCLGGCACGCAGACGGRGGREGPGEAARGAITQRRRCWRMPARQAAPPTSQRPVWVLRVFEATPLQRVVCALCARGGWRWLRQRVLAVYAVMWAPAAAAGSGTLRPAAAASALGRAWRLCGCCQRPAAGGGRVGRGRLTARSTQHAVRGRARGHVAAGVRPRGAAGRLAAVLRPHLQRYGLRSSPSSNAAGPARRRVPARGSALHGACLRRCAGGELMQAGASRRRAAAPPGCRCDAHDAGSVG